MTRRRLDQAMVDRGLAASRARARDLVLRGAVTIDGVVADKPAQPVAAAHAIRIDAAADRYVSRAGLKLAAALAHFGFDARDRLALDIGASTGGFTDVLLQSGARHVHAVDVGRDQLHPRLVADPRVTRHDGLDARLLTIATLAHGSPTENRLASKNVSGAASPALCRAGSAFGATPMAITADVAFISLTKALPSVLELASPGCWLVALVKPQFEVGPAGIGKGGVVRDAALRRQAVDDVAAWIGKRQGWRVVGMIESPIAGGAGNLEYLLGAINDG